MISAIIVSYDYNGGLPSTCIDVEKMSDYFTDIGISEERIFLLLDEDTPDRESFLSIFEKIPSFQRIIFYYTGHGVKDGIKLPNSDKIRYGEIRNLLEKKSQSYIMVMDCCNTGTMGFNYLIYRGKKIGEKNKVTQEKSALLIRASRRNTDAILHSEEGSLFTDRLLRNLKRSPSIEELYVKLYADTENISEFSYLLGQ